MAQESTAHNPFMLMLQPEVVLAAIEKSERLGRLNRHLCRPLDRPVLPNTPPPAGRATRAQAELDDSDDDESPVA